MTDAYVVNHLDWPDCRNVRDLGGIPTVAGRTTRTGALIRSDNHDLLTPDGIAAVHAANVSRVVDLRTPGECEHYPSPFRELPFYCNRTLVPELTPATQPPPSLLDDYLYLLDLNGGRYLAEAVAAIADASPGAVVVHCHAGKDRTGLVVALALRIAGVAPETIALDYAVTRERQAGSLGDAPPEVIMGSLDHLESRHSGAEAYLLGGGMRPEQLAALRDRLV